MRAKSVWKHATKYKGKTYRGTYGIATDKSLDVERAFLLVRYEGKHALAFESHEAAKQAGWRKVK